MSIKSEERAPGDAPSRTSRLPEDVASRVDVILERAMEIARVAAPTNDEFQRAELVAEMFRKIGCEDVSIDDLADVTARVPGSDRSKTVLVAAHIDTVFPRETALDIRRQRERVYGPGIGDNCLGVSAVMAIPEILQALDLTPATDILLTGNVGEEGLGDLRGMRRVMDDHLDIGAVIAVEGHNLGRVTHVAVGSRRLRVRVTGGGGHSWGDFGNPNAIHGAAEIIHELARIPLPTNPKTTLSVGTIEGGISVNTIAPEATFDLDMRSVEAFALKRLSDRADRIIGAARLGMLVDSTVIGDRPAGYVSPNSRIVRLAVEILDGLGIEPTGDASSTDANVAISRGIPAICVGLTSGGHVHREDEYIDVGPVGTGVAQLVQLTLAVADELAAGTLGA